MMKIPMLELNILSIALRDSPGFFPRADRIKSSARRAKPILNGQINNVNVCIQGDMHSPRPPVRTLANSDSIYTLIDTFDTFLAVYISKESPCRWWLHAGSHLLMTSYFSSLHSCTKAYRFDAFKQRRQSIKIGLPIVAYACVIPPVIPPRRPAKPGLTPIFVVADSTSDAVKSRTAPLVEASIQA